MLEAAYTQVIIYQKLAYRFWGGLSPLQYGTILIVVAVAGWFCMKNNSK